MNINQLKYLCCIHRTGSISLAAAELSVSQQALSKAIMSLENEFGIKLFHREKAGMRPTKQGLVVLSKASLILKQVDDLLDTVGKMKLNSSNSMGVGIPEGLVGTSSDPIPVEKLVRFNDQSKDFSYLIKELPNDDIRRNVLSGALDSGIVIGDAPAHCKSSLLVEAPLKAVVLNSSPLALQNGITWEDLREYEFVMAVDDRRIKADIIERCRQSGFEPTFLPPVSQFEGNISLACASKAILLCHDETRILESAAEPVSVLEFQPDAVVTFSLHYLWNERQSARGEHLLFLDFLKDTLSC